MDNAKISKTSAMLMTMTAYFFDGLQAFLNFILIGFLINWIISIYAFLTFYIWFKMKGVRFTTVKNATSFNGSFLGKLIPGLNTIPFWTLSVGLILAPIIAKDAIKTIEHA